MNITIIGTGYVGLTTAVFLCLSGHKVNALDIDQKKIDTIKSGKSFFFEPFLDEFVSEAVKSGRFFPTTDYTEAVKGSDIFFSCVGTPDRPDGSSNLDFVFDVAKKVFSLKKSGNIVFVQKSTVPVGTGEKIKEIASKTSPSLDLHYVSNPEFLAEGSSVYDTLFFDRLVIGTDSEHARDTLVSIFSDLDKFGKKLTKRNFGDYVNTYKEISQKNGLDKIKYEDKIILTTVQSAELIKVTANSFLALKISFANSIAMLADKSGADVTEVMEGIGRDKRIGRSFLYSGLGWGGGCFPKDVSGLISTAKDFGVKMPIMKASVDVNSGMVDYVFSKFLSLKLKKGEKVTILGLSFKPGTSDVRKSQSIKLANKIAMKKKYSVFAYDPHANEEASHDLDKSVVLVESLEDAIVGSSCVIIATEWKEFRDYNWVKNSDKLTKLNLIDARNCISKDTLGKIKEIFNYKGVGVN